jgi:hypothetical protein
MSCCSGRWLGGRSAGPPEMASMLGLRQRQLAEALEEVGQCGVCKISGALTPDARHELRMALEALDFQRAPQWVAEVRQDFDLLANSQGWGVPTQLWRLLWLSPSRTRRCCGRRPCQWMSPPWQTSCLLISLCKDTARGPQAFRLIATAGGSSSSSPYSPWAAPPNSACSANAGGRRGGDSNSTVAIWPSFGLRASLTSHRSGLCTPSQDPLTECATRSRSG